MMKKKVFDPDWRHDIQDNGTRITMKNATFSMNDI